MNWRWTTGRRLVVKTFFNHVRLRRTEVHRVSENSVNRMRGPSVCFMGRDRSLVEPVSNPRDAQTIHIVLPEHPLNRVHLLRRTCNELADLPSLLSELQRLPKFIWNGFGANFERFRIEPMLHTTSHRPDQQDRSAV